jgi:hypothetical protein
MYFLFYSNKCIFSNNLIQIIYNEGLDDKFIKIDVDDPKNKDKLFGIQKVPTIITKEIRSQLVGKAAFEWVKNKKYFHQITNNINYINTIINPNIKSDIDNLANNNKDANRITDKFTDVNDNKEDNSGEKNKLSLFNKLTMDVPITNNIDKDYKIFDKKIGNTLNNQMQKYIEIRNMMNQYNNNNNISVTNIND